MNCRKVRRCLFSYFKDELPEDFKTEIKLHLEGCPDCKREALEVERIASLVEESLETLEPSPDFNQKLLSEVQKLSSERVREVRRTSFSPARILGLGTRIRWAFAGSVAVVILASVLWFTHQRTPLTTEPISAEGERTEGLQLVNREDNADSVYQQMLRRLADESRGKGKTFVLDNFGSVGSRGVDGMKVSEDLYKRFIMETAGYRTEERRMRSQYVLPVVSTHQASVKQNY
jgi:hypothetical protein